MEWLWLSIITLAILFLLLVTHRLIYIRGFRTGALKVVADWKRTLQEEEVEDDGEI